MPVLREIVGSTLRGVRMRQARTLREVSSTARVSLGYLSEIERGQKEASSELLAAICAALDVELSELFGEVSQTLRREEKLAAAGRLAAVPATPTPLSTSALPTTSLPTTSARTGAPEASVRVLPTVAA